MSVLFTPGPVQVSGEVQEALSSQPLHHRSQEFIELSKHTWSSLQRLLSTTGNVHIVPGSGTTAIEAAFVSTTRQQDRVAVFVHGRFGHRLVNIASEYKVPSAVYEVPWGESISPEEVDAFLSTCSDCQSIWLVHAETSTGVALDLEAISRVIQSNHPHMLICVDAITSLGVQECLMDSWSLDVVVGATQKGLACPPGLGFVGLSNRAHEAMNAADLTSYNLKLSTIAKAQLNGLFVWTPPTTLIAALSIGLDHIFSLGLKSVYERHTSAHAKIMAVAQQHGIAQLGDGTAKGLVVLEHSNASTFVTTLLDQHQLRVANGQDELAGKVLRIGTMGAYSPSDLDRLLSALDKVFSEWTTQ